MFNCIYLINNNNKIQGTDMLPRSLYELLPYLYLVVGAVTGLLIKSSLILIASLLLIAAGVLTIVMRHTYREEIREAEKNIELDDKDMRTFETTGYRVDKRSGLDRRKRIVARFPFVDSVGQVITYDRRVYDRRVGVQQNYA